MGYVGCYFFCYARAVAGMTHGVKTITRSDKVCLGACFVAIVIWQITDIPLLAVIIVTSVDVMGFYPTVRNIWKNPYDENAFSHFLFGITYAMSLLALQSYNLVTTIYPSAVCFASWAFLGYIFWRRHVFQKNSVGIHS